LSAALLARARRLGLIIRADGADLVINPASLLTPELRASLRAAKPDLLALIRAEADTNALAQASVPAAAPGAAAKDNGTAAGEPSNADAEAPLGQFRFRLLPGATLRAPLPPIVTAIAQAFGGLEALTFRLLPSGAGPSPRQSGTDAYPDCQKRAAGEGDPKGPDGHDALDPREVAERLCRLLDAQDARQRAHAAAAEAARTNRSPPTPTAQPSEPLVHRLSAALATPRPWQRITDPVRARSYFEAHARHLLAPARDPVALVEREERLAIEQGKGVADQCTTKPREGPASRRYQARAAIGNGPLAPQPYQGELAANIPLGVFPRKANRSARLPREASTDECNDRRDPVELPSLPELVGEQADALASIKDFLAGAKQYFCLHGLAGTGKTTVIATLARKLPNCALVAPTGKAASVLARKTGLTALTLHQLLYTPKVDEEGNLIGFVERHQPGELADHVVLVDEASMCGMGLAGDLLRTGAQVVASGDPGQLPPVNQEPFFTKADVTLREIRRQAAGSSIIHQAHEVRAGRCYTSVDENFQIIDRREAMRRLQWADIVLCWRNETRHRLNSFIRWHRRRLPVEALPNRGEPVMCLENQPSGIMNGEIFTVHGFDPVRGILLEDGPGWIGNPWFEWLSPDEKQPRQRAVFALGYAITTHKSQGSEWPNVLVLDEFTGADHARWLYTAITRASAAICIVPPSENHAAQHGTHGIS
jgi:exodeoxyribonuclease-5